MSKPPVTVRAVPMDSHPDGYHHSGEAYGTHLVVNHQGVWVDGEHVIQRDRRAKVNRTPGHPWLAEDAPYTGFYINCETRKEDGA
jgi:hypothetical protein